MFFIYLINFQIISSMIILMINIGVIVIWFFINQIIRSIKNHEWDQQRADTFDWVDVTDIECLGRKFGSSKKQVVRDLVYVEW